MRLSDIKGKRVLEVIAELVVPIATISQDDEAAEMFRSKPVPEGLTAASFTAQRIKQSVPVILRKYNDEIIHIMATLNGVSDAEYSDGLTIVSLMKDINDVVTDPAFAQLFR